jgi:hypothetical protein
MIIVTAYDDNYKEIGDLTSEINYRYAKKWNYSFCCHRIDTKKKHPSWMKIDYLIQSIEDHEYAMWIDADAVITNDKINCNQWLSPQHDIVIGEFQGQINCGVMFLNKNARPLLKKINDQFQFINRFPWEQGALSHLMQFHEWKSRILTVSRDFFNQGDNLFNKDCHTPWNCDSFLFHASARDNKMKHLLEKLKK